MVEAYKVSFSLLYGPHTVFDLSDYHLFCNIKQATINRTGPVSQGGLLSCSKHVAVSVRMVDIGCKSRTPTALTLTRRSHLTSPNRCYTRLQRLFIAEFGLQMAAFDAKRPRSDSLLF